VVAILPAQKLPSAGARHGPPHGAFVQVPPEQMPSVEASEQRVADSTHVPGIG
jgi:hypothetical protein